MDIKKPNRATRTYTQRLVAGPDRVFPLLCPVREAEWLEGWDPIVVFTHSGVAEPDCVFMTLATPNPATWFITRHEPERGYVEMLKIVPEMTACKMSLQLAPTPTGCDATITYSHTSLGAQGDAFVASFTEDFYVQFMCAWEARMNHFLRTGEALKATQ